MHKCFQCGAEDHEIPIPGQDSQHFVKPEVRYLGPREDYHPRLKAFGWEPKTFRGKPAMVRRMCVNCLNENYLRDQVWGEMRRAALKLETKPDKDAEFYSLLCQ